MPPGAREICLSLLLSLFLCCCSPIPPERQLVVADAAQATRSKSDCRVFLGNGVSDNVAFSTGLGQQFSVVIWNVQKKADKKWLKELGGLALDTELLLLQEGSLSQNLLGFLEEQEYFWNFHSSFAILGRETGVLTAAKSKPLASCGLRNQEPVTGLPKTILLTKYAFAFPHPPLVVANIHGINLTTGIEAYQEQLAGLTELLQKLTGPLIVAGDFNNWTEEREAVVETLRRELALKSVPFSPEHRTTFWGKPVDHVFYRGLELRKATSLPTEMSDHNPLEVSFTLPPPKSSS